jgi:hypothetical protein
MPGGRLWSLSEVHGEWPPGPMRAECRREWGRPRAGVLVPHTSPHPKCSCGISAWAERAEAEETLALIGQFQRLVMGQVLLWGRILARESEYRAEFARIAELIDLGERHVTGYEWAAP